MISRAASNRMIVTASLLLAIYILLSTFRIFKGEPDWMEYTLIGGAMVLVFIAAFARLKHRIEIERSVKSTRATVLKHLWELRHRREW